MSQNLGVAAHAGDVASIANVMQTPAGQPGRADVGPHLDFAPVPLLIHEGQITYGDSGFTKILDFGELWARMYDGLPLPLGLDVVRKDLGEQTAHLLSEGLKRSIHYGYTHQAEAIPYALKYGRGISTELGERFVKMYVSELTIDMGARGKKALEVLYQLAEVKGLIDRAPQIRLL